MIVDSLNLSLLFSTNHVPTRYLDNMNDSNLIIDLMFLHSDLSELNSHLIHPEWHLTSDHAPLTITISIIEEYINTHRRTITKNSNEEDMFIKEVITSFAKLDMSSMSNITDLEKAVSDFANIIDHL